MSPEVWTHTLTENRRSLLGWAIGLAGVSALYAGFYPAVSAPEFTDAYASMPSGVVDAFGMQDLTTAAGYLGSTVFGILGPALVVVFAIGWGARLIAGEESTGALDLLLAHPVSRPSVLLQRALALVVALVVLGLVVTFVVAAVSGPAALDVPLARIAAGALHLVALGALAGGLALGIGAATGSRAVAVAGAAGVTVLAWMANALAPQVQGLGWLAEVSPWSWYARGTPLADGVAWGDLGLLLGVAGLAVGVGLALFRRRDLAV